MGLRCDPALALTTSLGFLMGKASGAFPLEIWAVSEGVKTEKVLRFFGDGPGSFGTHRGLLGLRKSVRSKMLLSDIRGSFLQQE